MNSFSSIVILGLLAFVAVNSLDLNAVEKEIASAPFVDVAPSSVRIKDKISKYCSCDDKNHCECCAAPRVFGLTLKGCAKFGFDATRKVLLVKINMLDNKILDAGFSTKKLERLCGKLPGRANILGFCLTTDTTQTTEEGLKSCSTLTINFKSAEAAKVTFACLTIKDGKVSIKASEGPLKIQVKNPLKILVDFIKSTGKKTTASKA